MSKQIRILIVDGYDKPGRAELESFGCAQAAPLYRDMLSACLPPDVTIETDIAYPADADTALPQGQDLRKYHGVAWTGSSLTIHKNEPRVTRQIDYARAIYASGVPQFGSCWAAQIAAAAAGGVCSANPKGREFGLSRKVHLTEAGRSHPMYFGKSSAFDAFTVHYDIVETLPPQSRLLASNQMTDVQALDIEHAGGSFWAVQYHPEFTLDYMAHLAAGRKQSLIDDGHFSGSESADAFIGDWMALHQTPQRTDIAWRQGIDDDILDTDIRFAEARNWLAHKVMPRVS